MGDSALGPVLVAATGAGVCAIFFGDGPNELERDLDRRFPQAQRVWAGGELEDVVAKVVGHVEHPKDVLNLALDIRGTAFQKRVWQALRGIPVGKTFCYEQIANGIGAPEAVRAVAGACAANVLAVAIPCHRAIRKDGRLSGYRWGVDRKRMLLEREAGAALTG